MAGEEELLDLDPEKARKGIEARILTAGLVLVVLLLLWQFYVGEINNVRNEWRTEIMNELTNGGKVSAMVTSLPLSVGEYFSLFGLKTLVPHDIILLMYSAAVIMSIACILLLAEALLAVDERKHKKAKQLTERGMKYFGWILTFLIFFITIQWMEESLFPFGSIFQDNMWIILGIATVITVVVRVLVNRAMKEVSIIGFVERACKSCGKPVEPSAKFCGSCGHAV
jgi:hypothetical protein